MSKAKKRFSDSRMKQMCFFPDAPLRAAEEVDAEVLNAIAGIATRLPGEVVKALRQAAESVSGQRAPSTEWDTFKANRSRISPKVQSVVGMDRLENDFISDLVWRATESGFWLALQRYSKHLRGSKEAMAFINARESAANRGRKTQSEKREARYKEIRETQARLDAEGKRSTYAAIAAECGYGRATVERAINQRTAKRTKR